MRVIEVAEFGGPEVLRLGSRPDPVARPGEVVVGIQFATVNPSDLGARSGGTHRRVPGMPLPFVPGWDLAGTVLTIGEGVTRFRPGDRVIGMIPWVPVRARVGAYAEAAAVEESWLAHVPDGLDLAAAATLPLSGLTAAQGLGILNAAPGSAVLVTGASGAVGWFATQLAARAGCRVLALASHGDEAWVASLGAEVEMLPRGTDLGGIGPVDHVLDAVPLGPAAAAGLRKGGTAVFTRPAQDPPPDGVTFETVWVEPDAAGLERLAAELAAGRLVTRVAEVIPLAEAARAHALAERGGARGKLVLASARRFA
jgi:NADPH2:quinone reductase